MGKGSRDKNTVLTHFIEELLPEEELEITREEHLARTEATRIPSRKRNHSTKNVRNRHKRKDLAVECKK